MSRSLLNECEIQHNMSTIPSNPEGSMSTPGITASTPYTGQQGVRPQRILACLLCQQRKIKCDRKFPCANCIKQRTQCVQATLATRRRRRKFPENVLMERLRKYEDLLRQNNIKFEALPKEPSEQTNPNSTRRDDNSEEESSRTSTMDWSSPAMIGKSDRVFETKSFWQALSPGSQDYENDDNSSNDDLSEGVVSKAWNDWSTRDDHLLFGMRTSTIELSTYHPEPAQILKLWQIYLENVNPMLKITHTPSLQARIIEAVGNMGKIDVFLEVLMFSIYCTAILSLSDEEAVSTFGFSKDDLMSRYRLGCQQALLNCGFLRCDNRDCLTAFYLYLISARINTIPKSLNSMLGVAMRIAERMGMHEESKLAKCTPFEAEMRRRLWWSLVLFDARVGELAEFPDSKLVPTWQCNIPLNVNDFDLRPEMKELPPLASRLTEALFSVVRAEFADFIRHSAFLLDFTAPAFRSMANRSHTYGGEVSLDGGEIKVFEKMIEAKYLQLCNLEDAQQYMTVWMTRAFLARYRLLEHHSKHSSSSPPTEAQRDVAISHAIDMLDCDTKLMTSPLTKGYLWLIHFHFPFVAYIQIVQDLRRRPLSQHAARAWDSMSENYSSRFGYQYKDDSVIFFKIFPKILLQAWEARDAVFKQKGEILQTPEFVLGIKHIMTQKIDNTQNTNVEEEGQGDVGKSLDEFLKSIGMDDGGMMFDLNNDVDWSGVSWHPTNEMPVSSQIGGPYMQSSNMMPYGVFLNQYNPSGNLNQGLWPPTYQS